MFVAVKNLIAEALYPSFCYECGGSGSYLCENCFNKIGLLPHPICPHCGIAAPNGELAKNCRGALGLIRYFGAADYKNDAVQRLIHDMKYKRAYALTRPLAKLTYFWLASSGYAELFQTKNIALTAVPMHSHRERNRGFNQAELIAEHLSEFLGVPYKKGVLRKIKNTPSQVDVATKEKRLENLQGAYAVKNIEPIRDRTMVLIDDVATTGATLAECARVLRRAGIHEVWGLTVAVD